MRSVPEFHENPTSQAVRAPGRRSECRDENESRPRGKAALGRATSSGLTPDRNPTKSMRAEIYAGDRADCSATGALGLTVPDPRATSRARARPGRSCARARRTLGRAACARPRGAFRRCALAGFAGRAARASSSCRRGCTGRCLSRFAAAARRRDSAAARVPAAAARAGARLVRTFGADAIKEEKTSSTMSSTLEARPRCGRLNCTLFAEFS
jgi:hypothetical protein